MQLTNQITTRVKELSPKEIDSVLPFVEKEVVVNNIGYKTVHPGCYQLFVKMEIEGEEILLTTISDDVHLIKDFDCKKDCQRTNYENAEETLFLEVCFQNSEKLDEFCDF